MNVRKSQASVGYMVGLFVLALVGLALVTSVVDYATRSHAAPMPSAPAQLAQEVSEDAVPAVCTETGDLMLTGTLAGRAGTWWVAGGCLQQGQQLPECLYFVGYGGDEGTCVLIEYADPIPASRVDSER